MSNLYFKKDVHKSLEGLLYGLYVYQYLLDTSTFGLLLRCLVQEQLISIKSKAPTLRVALYVVIAAAFLAFVRHLRPPERYAVIIDFIGNASAPSQAIIYWLDTVILLLQVTEALLVFKVIKSEEIPRRSTSPSTTTTAAPARTGSPSSNINTPGTGGSSLHAAQQGRFGRTETSSNGESGSGSTSAMPALVDQSSVSASSSSNNQPPEYTPHRVNNNNNNRRSEDLDDMSPEYYEDEEEVRFSTDLDRQQQQAQPSQGSSSSQRNRSFGAAGRGASNSNRRRRSDTDDSGDESSEEDDEDVLGDDYEEVLEQETFVFQLQFRELVAYMFSSQEALTMPDARTLTRAAVDNGGQSGSGSAQQRELPV
ncbi:MAG: hypothetical protein JOS17DRAFT_745364 [Linnemannia elongata]|nr:MAG: hypothetical protein JOS17DRAFT_745364 [Linnemannia elongata]